MTFQKKQEHSKTYYPRGQSSKLCSSHLASGSEPEGLLGVEKSSPKCLTDS